MVKSFLLADIFPSKVKAGIPFFFSLANIYSWVARYSVKIISFSVGAYRRISSTKVHFGVLFKSGRHLQQGEDAFASTVALPQSLYKVLAAAKELEQTSLCRVSRVSGLTEALSPFRYSVDKICDRPV